MDWLGQASYHETIYQQQFETSCVFADALAKEGVKCLVLKGLAIGTYYPTEKSRAFGDLDCYLLKDSEPAFEYGNKVGRVLGAKVEQAGYKHSHIHLNDLLIENHEYLTNFNETKQGVKIEKILRELAVCDNYRTIADSNLLNPSPEFNVLFLLKHSLGDFIANDMPFKAIYDWAVFLKAEQRNIDWKRVEVLLDECRLRGFFNLMTELCMTFLGLELHSGDIAVTSNRKLVDDMLFDVLRKPIQNCASLSFWQKIPAIWKRFNRQLKYRDIETETPYTLFWTAFAYSSYMKRHVSLD